MQDIVRGTPELDRPVRGNCVFLLTVLPADTPFRPQRLTPRVTMPGPQSAIVVGPKGEEIHADDFGRVKVHFHWDRYDESDEKSTCWVRVSQPWAGKNWGGYFIPRIGQEVIVDFLNGDPDRPIIVGRVYNDDQPIPFDSHTQSGFRTRSTPKGSAVELQRVPLRRQEGLGAGAACMPRRTRTSRSRTTRRTGSATTARRRSTTTRPTHIKNNRTETVDVNEKIDIGANRTETVGANEDITIGANRTESVGANETVTIGAARDHTISANDTKTVGASESITVGASRTDTVGASMTQTIGGSLSQTVAGGITTTTPGAYTITAVGGLTVVAPGGVKYIDSFFSRLGGNLLENYNNIVKLTPMSIEGTGFKAEACGIKIDEGGLFNKKAGVALLTLGSFLENAGPVLKKAAVVVDKAGMHLIG